VHAVGIVAAAGSGLRLGAERDGRAIPKALVLLGGRPLVCWAVDSLRAGGVAEVVVAVPAPQQAAFAAALPDDVHVVVGGDTRTASVRVALAAAREHAPADGRTAVLVHDAARPLTPPAVVARVLSALADGAAAVVPVLPVVDTTVTVDRDGLVVADLPRADLRRVQTPQGFDRETLVAAYGRADGTAGEYTDDASVVRAAGVPVHTVAGDERAAKITVAHDLLLAELAVRPTGEQDERGVHG
jgi:2-C-methyl-D-erythritol 4-phosphate cytidylyltransferase